MLEIEVVVATEVVEVERVEASRSPQNSEKVGNNGVGAGSIEREFFSLDSFPLLPNFVDWLVGVEFLAERILMLPAMAIALSEDDTALFGEEEEREPRLLGFLVSFSDREGDGY